MTPTGTGVKKIRQLPALPSIVETMPSPDGDVLNDYLSGLAYPDVLTAANAKREWAAPCDGGDGSEGGSTYVVSAEVVKAVIKGRRF
jgi:hypothetical protein